MVSLVLSEMSALRAQHARDGQPTLCMQVHLPPCVLSTPGISVHTGCHHTFIPVSSIKPNLTFVLFFLHPPALCALGHPAVWSTIPFMRCIVCHRQHRDVCTNPPSQRATTKTEIAAARCGRNVVRHQATHQGESHFSVFWYFGP